MKMYWGSGLTLVVMLMKGKSLGTETPLAVVNPRGPRLAIFGPEVVFGVAMVELSVSVEEPAPGSELFVPGAGSKLLRVVAPNDIGPVLAARRNSNSDNWTATAVVGLLTLVISKR